MIFESLFKISAWPSLIDGFAVSCLLKINQRKKGVDDERYLLKGVLWNPSSGKTQEEVSSQMIDQQTIYISIPSHELDQYNLETFDLKSHIMTLKGIDYLITEVTNIDSVSFQMKLEKIEVKEIGDRGRRDY